MTQHRKLLSNNSKYGGRRFFAAHFFALFSYRSVYTVMVRIIYAGSEKRAKYMRKERPCKLRKMSIPQYTSIENALSVYYRHPEIGNNEMAILFGKRSPTTISRLKKIAKVQSFVPS